MNEDLAPPVDGKVLQLYFACHAKLPLGSYLRVTSSSQSGASSANNSNTNNNSSSNNNNSNNNNNINSNINKIQYDDLDDTNNSSIYSSSVEMVTSPETYPIWKTRTPVIRVVNNTNGGEEEDGIFCHTYRYLVVTPGNGNADHGSKSSSSSGGGGGGIITSDGQGGVIEVDQWEDPFLEKTETETGSTQEKQQEEHPQKSSVGIPYRTVEIDVSSVNSFTFGKVLTKSTTTNTTTAATSLCNDVTFTSDGVRIDKWNDISDVSFYSYHEKVKKETKKNQQLSSAVWTSGSDTDKDRTDSETVVDSNNTNNEDDSTVYAELGGAGATTKKLFSKRIFLVCYHLPIILGRDAKTGALKASFSESLLAKTELSGVSKAYATHWIGTVSSEFKTDEEKDEVRDLLEPMNCTPIFLDKSLRDSFYLGMCKQVLWPAFHNIDLLDISKSGWGIKAIADAPDASHWDQSRLDGWWRAYCEVNNIFTYTLMNLVKPHDKVWVHDYHLSLLPRMVHETKNAQSVEQTIQMVYFLHIPFPTSQVFREIEHGAEILEGMLHADVVGFHAFDHARHFLTASKRILGLSHESLVGGLIGVRYRGTKVLVTISNVSIETDVFQKSMHSPSVTEGAKMLKSKHNGRQIISGIDIAQGLSGVSLKLLAYERLLSDYPNWVGNVVLVQRNLIPSVRKLDEADTLKHVRYLVKRLQTNFGPDVIDYDEFQGSSLPREQRLILWLSSDVYMSTSIREGLNLLPLEYVYVNKHPSTPGVTLISEFSAMSSILNGALRVNPYDFKLASTIMDKALSMSIEEKLSRRERDIHFVSTSPSGQWTRNVLRDLNDVKLATATSTNNKKGKRSSRASWKLESVTSENVTTSTLLDSSSVTTAYNLSKKRVIFIDFNGTIVMKEPTGKYLKREMLGISGNKPPQETIKALTELCADKRNVVFVVSGDTETNIENAIGDIPGLGLAAGNGGSISQPLKPGESSRKWEAIDFGVNWETVVNITMAVLAKYTARANGSFVKHTSSSVGWSYYGCDPEWGELLATHLVMELEAAVHFFDVRIVKLKGVVEVVPRKLNKGVIVKKVLSDNGADFILCMGDDVSDEKMFTSIFSVLAESETQQQSIENELFHKSHLFTVTVGKKASNASYYVENAQDVAELLLDMTELRRNLGYGRAMSWDKSHQPEKDIFGIASFEG